MELPNNITRVVKNALDEDVGDGDITAQLIQSTAWASAQVVCRERAVICGRAWFEQAFQLLDHNCLITWHRSDGESIEADEIVCHLEGPARALVSGERTALNFLQTLSATATATRIYADCLIGTKTILLDTRKTIPGLRSAQKYAVLCGGGRNHRIGLFDAILIKENHIEAAGSIENAIKQMRAQFPAIPIEIEVESLPDLERAIAAGANIVLLDNFSNADISEAVKVNGDRIKLEASGGYDFDGLRTIANMGVDYVSVGALTKHIRAIDFSMRFLNRACPERS
ncbi:MAG: carboxylating nicotinate-nucleotide diphosphorylase [Proteobacteria bacterium]|nr:carboxylating nicotinate-nucleotide diphosphorylase [Pseudomonadota bacterium]